MSYGQEPKIKCLNFLAAKLGLVPELRVTSDDKELSGF